MFGKFIPPAIYFCRMKRILILPNLLLACAPLLAQSFEDVSKAIPYVQLAPTDSVLTLEPTEPDSMMWIAPGSIFALKGEYAEVSTFYSTGRPPEKADWYEVRYAGKITPPDFPTPPMSRLPRNRDGWLPTDRFRPVAVSFSEAAEDLLVAFPFFEVEELESSDFYQFFEPKVAALTQDIAKRYVTQKSFKLPFENGTEKLVASDSVFGIEPDVRRVHYEYLGQYATQGFYLVQVGEGAEQRYELIGRKDGMLLASIERPWVTPSVSPDGLWVATSGGTATQPLNYVHFHRFRDGKMREEFTVRLPFQKVTGLDWEDDEHLLFRVQQDDPINTSINQPERYYRVKVQLPD